MCMCLSCTAQEIYSYLLQWKHGDCKGGENLDIYFISSVQHCKKLTTQTRSRNEKRNTMMSYKLYPKVKNHYGMDRYSRLSHLNSGLYGNWHSRFITNNEVYEWWKACKRGRRAKQWNEWRNLYNICAIKTMLWYLCVNSWRFRTMT